MTEPDSGRLEVGAIGRAHGVRGDVIVRLTTDRNERVAPGAELYAGDRRLEVVRSRPHQKGWIVTFDGIGDRTAAEDLRGAVLSADPIDDDDVIWVHELIGATLEELDGTPRGTIEAVQENPAADLMVTDSGALVPLTFLVEQRDGVVVVDPPPGLFDLDDEDG